MASGRLDCDRPPMVPMSECCIGLGKSVEFDSGEDVTGILFSWGRKMRHSVRLTILAVGISMAMTAGLQAKMIILTPPNFQPGGPMIPAPAPKQGKGHTSGKLSYPAPPKVDVTKIKAAIKALSSGRYAVREKAAHELLAMGDPVMPYLKAALKGLTTPEMRHLLRRDLRAIAKTDLMRGPLITLKLKNVPATTAIMDVCKQAGTTANFWNSNTTSTVSLDVKNAPFWRVIAILAEKTNTSPAFGYMNNGQPGIPFSMGQNTIGALTSFDGAFAVSLSSGNYQRSCDYTQPKPTRSSSFSIQANLLMLPNQIGNVQIQQIAVTKAVDSKGQSLLSPNMNNYFGGQFQGAVANCNFNLNYPKHPGRSIKILKGYIPITAAVGRKKYTVKLSTKKTETLRIDGVRMKFGPEKFVNGNWQLNYVVSWQGPQSPQEQNIQNQVSNTTSMLGQASNGAAPNFINFSSINGGQNETTYTLQTNIELTKLTLKIFSRAVNLKIPFKFTNVPMP